MMSEHKRVAAKSPVLENGTQGSVEGTPGNRSSYSYKDKVYIAIITLLAAAAVFLFLTHRRDCQLIEGCPSGKAVHGRGMGMGQGMGFGMNAGREVSEARNDLFNLIISGSSDTTMLFEHLEKIVGVQRQNQKRTLLKIMTIRDSLQGSEREEYLKNLNDRFCGQSGRGCGAGK
jgi:hypothetical protein